MIIISFIVMGVFGTATAFSPNVEAYIVLRCLMGAVAFAGFTATVALGES